MLYMCASIWYTSTCWWIVIGRVDNVCLRLEVISNFGYVICSLEISHYVSFNVCVKDNISSITLRYFVGT